MQLLDPTLLISLVGIPAKHLKRALRRELDVYSRATSNEGLLCIRKVRSTLPCSHGTGCRVAQQAVCQQCWFCVSCCSASLMSLACIAHKSWCIMLHRDVHTQYWDAHCSTVGKLPAIALLDQSSCPRGISDAEFLALLSRLTSLQQWQIWELRSTLDSHGCGFVGCPEFTLLVVLMCAAVAGQQMQAVHAYHSSICRVFTGAVASALAAALE
ncbi:hypothetical protein COO60DRAFT_127462 [Scenedesmus sp. NREL 46B-D3]|nr:hypothetical protein COO60DRAFT_127462 [Scenedesmus sp. NREL 46B-D3]